MANTLRRKGNELNPDDPDIVSIRKHGKVGIILS